MVSEEQNSDIELASEVVPVPQVQPEVEAQEVMDVPNEEGNNIPHRKPRSRKKALHSAILKQMEFYFGDANLTKDRFLADLVKKDPDVDLEIFLRFNRIRSLTTDKNRIVKALRKSTILQVSEDGTKVRRITPIVEKENVDDCTVYVQRLPSDADHEWLTTLFSEYGPVAYVSIPKFKFNHKIKGFAFVEFETPEGAKKCLKAFRKKGHELPSQTSPTEVLSITTFAEEEKHAQNGLENPEKSNENNSDNKVNTDNEEQSEISLESEKPKIKKKRKKSIKSDDPVDSGTDQSDSTNAKRKKDDNIEKDSSICLSDTNTEEEKRGKKRKHRLSSEGVRDSDPESQKNIKDGCKKPKRNKVKEQEVEDESDNCIKNETDKAENNEKTVKCSNEEEMSEKKKKKKRKRNNRNAYETLETVDMGLQVMGKKDWKKLRNKYLELQRSKMKQLKQHMRRARWNQWGDRNRMETEQEEVACNKKENPASSLEFIPGVIVKVELSEACVDPKGFKTQLRSNSHIKYVDIKEGSNEAYVRCDSSEAATALTQETTEERCYKVLIDAEEKSYWDKIIKDRGDKIGNKIRVKQRGREKLLKKAEKELGKHIKFDEV